MRYVEGNRLELLRSGAQYFPAVLQAIDAAREEIFLETYLYGDDATGRAVAEALARAARRGARTHLLLDGFGAKDFPDRFRALLAAAGVGILVFRPEVSPWSLRRGRLRRMHRKLATIDGGVAFVGGINVIDDWDEGGPAAPRYDYAVRIEGPLAGGVRAAAARLWAQVAWTRSRRRWPGLAALRAAADAPASRPPEPQGIRAALVVRDSFRHRKDIERAYLQQIGAAKTEVLIASAYFFPGRRFRRALVLASARGVRVRLLLQGRVEYFLAHYASRALYGRLLDAGVEIHEYPAGYLHAKVAVFDGRVACVGSANIDPFSLLLAREANVFVDDRKFAGELRASLEHAMQTQAAPLAPRQWRELPLLQRGRIAIGYALARMLISLAGLERYH